MDLYLIYNAFCNILDICVTPEENITFKHELIANNPLIIIHLINNEYLKKQSGGGLRRMGAFKKKKPNAATATGNTPASEAPEKKSEGDGKDEKKVKTGKMAMLKSGLKTMSETKVNAGDDEEDTKNMIETFKKILKFCIGFLFLIFIPIVPWFYISFHAFKSLFTLIQLNINTM